MEIIILSKVNQPLKENIFFSHDDLDLKNDMNIRGKLFVGISVEGDAGPTYHNITKTKSK
jgi:hypothetical protein